MMGGALSGAVYKRQLLSGFFRLGDFSGLCRSAEAWGAIL